MIPIFVFAHLGVLFGDTFLGQVFTAATWIELCRMYPEETIMKKFQPFNLTEALAGAKVVTRQGSTVTDLEIKDPFYGGSWPVIGVIHRSNGNVSSLSWTKEGRWLTGPSPEDLFMANSHKKKAIYWTNFYPGGESVGYSTRKEADEFAHKTRIGGKARKVVLEVAE